MSRQLTDRNKGNYFAATLLFRSHVGDNESLRPLCEERVLLLRAATSAEAQAQASRYGRSEEHSYRSVAGDVVRWTFVRVLGVQEVGTPPVSGVWEVSSRYVRRRLATLRQTTRGGSKRRRDARRGQGSGTR